jgi:undecaprenyl pyrophosphate phosphatase UppP
MPSGLRHRFWLESVLGSVSGILAIITVFWHDWIEVVFGTDPDNGNGTAEWLAVLVLFLLTAALTVGARREWRRARLAAS